MIEPTFAENPIHMMDDSERSAKKRGIPLEDLIAPLVFIVAIAAAIGLWHRIVGAPFWLAALLGVPTGLVTIIGGLWLLSRLK